MSIEKMNMDDMNNVTGGSEPENNATKRKTIKVGCDLGLHPKYGTIDPVCKSYKHRSGLNIFGGCGTCIHWHGPARGDEQGTYPIMSG